jgi:hypothetical protein
MLAYCTIVATSIAGYLGFSWPAFLCGGGMLALISILEQRKLRARFAAIGATDMLAMAGFASLGYSVLAAVAAYGLGVLTRFIFGAIL